MSDFSGGTCNPGDNVKNGSRRSNPSLFRTGIHLAIIGTLIAILFDLLWLNFHAQPQIRQSAVLPIDAHLTELRTLALADPLDRDLHLTLGKAYLNLHHYASARAEFDIALKNHADEVEVLQDRVVANSALLRDELVRSDLRRLIALKPRRLNTYLSLSENLLNGGDTAQAKEVLGTIPRTPQGLPDVDGDPFVASDLVATAYSHTGDWNATLSMIERPLNQRPDRTASLVEKGRALHALGRKLEAIPLLEVGMKTAPTNPDLLMLLATAYQTRALPGDTERAFTAIRDAARNNGMHGPSILAFAKECDRRHYRAAAAFAYQRAVELGMEGMLPLLRSGDLMLELGNREEGWYRRGRYFELTGNSDRALVEYKRLTTLHNCCRSGYLHLARVYSARREAKSTIDCLNRAMNLDTMRSKELRWLLAMAYGADHQLQKQVDLLTSIIADGDKANKNLIPTAIVPSENSRANKDNLGVPKEQKFKEQKFKERLLKESAEACFQMAALVKAAGKEVEAENWVGRAIAFEPNEADYETELGVLQLDHRSAPAQLHSAIDHLKRAVRLNPESHRACYYLGLAAGYVGDTEEAVLALRHAIDIEPENGTGYHALSLALQKSGRSEEAKEMETLFRRYQSFAQTREVFEARAKREPSNAEAQRKLGDFHFRANEMLAAIESYQASLLLSPHQPVVRRRLADALGSLGRREEQQQQLAIIGATPTGSADPPK